MSEASENPSSKLQFFPVMFFASGMGIGGAGLVLQKITKAFDMSTFFHVIAGIVDVLSALVLVTVTVVYLRKVKNYWPEVKKELFHPMRINFFAALAISTLIVQMLLESLHVPFGVLVAMFYFAALFQLFFSLHVIRYWFAAEIKQKMASPAWFVPIVGNIIVPVAAFSLCALELYHMEHSHFYECVGIIGAILTILIVATVAVRTLIGIRHTEICILEE